jgi:hypothetical protein
MDFHEIHMKSKCVEIKTELHFFQEMRGRLKKITVTFLITIQINHEIIVLDLEIKKSVVKVIYSHSQFLKGRVGVIVIYRHFQQFFSYVVTTRFMGEENTQIIVLEEGVRVMMLNATFDNM